MNAITQPTHWVRLYLSGPIEVAKQLCREECLREGLCVTIEPTTFIYTGGEEQGYVVGLINYPRFPTSVEAINARARDLAVKLLDRTCQHSVLVMTPQTSEWITKRAVQPKEEERPLLAKLVIQDREDIRELLRRMGAGDEIAIQAFKSVIDPAVKQLVDNAVAKAQDERA